jgi:hypothetical protein
MSGRPASQHCEEVERGCASNSVCLRELAFWYCRGCCCGIGGKGGGKKPGRSCEVFGGN